MIDEPLSYPKKDSILLVRKSLVDICDGDVKASIFLSYLLYWHKIKIEQNKKNRHLNNIAEKHGDEPIQDTSELQYHTDIEIYQETLGLLPKKRLAIYKRKLLKLRYITIHKNPNPRYKFDNTTFYRVEIDTIQEALDKLKRKQSIPQDEATDNPKGGNEQPNERQTITETTTETTTESNKKNKQKKKSLLDEALEDEKIKELMSFLEIDEDFISELIAYRRDIKKPFRTIRGLSGMLKDLRSIKEQLGISPIRAFEIMQEREWLTLKVEYLKKPQPQQQYRKEPEKGSIGWLIQNGLIPDVDGNYRTPTNDTDDNIFDVEVE